MMILSRIEDNVGGGREDEERRKRSRKKFNSAEVNAR